MFSGVPLKTSFAKAKLGADGKQAKSFKIIFPVRLPLPPFRLNLKLSHFLCQPFYAVFVLSRKVVYFLHGAVYLLNACRHFVQQINRAVQEVNSLARKNKDSIEGLAEEVGKFKV